MEKLWLHFYLKEIPPQHIYVVPVQLFVETAIHWAKKNEWIHASIYWSVFIQRERYPCIHTYWYDVERQILLKRALFPRQTSLHLKSFRMWIIITFMQPDLWSLWGTVWHTPIPNLGWSLESQKNMSENMVLYITLSDKYFLDKLDLLPSLLSQYIFKNNSTGKRLILQTSTGFCIWESHWNEWEYS